VKALIGEDAKSLCLKLVHAETEEGVIAILRRAGLLEWREAWKPYGGISNNRGIVGNQQSSPVAALVEKLVNSIDAVLTAECFRSGIDPEGPEAPKTMQEALETFFDVRSGHIQTLRPGERAELGERIQLVATGSKAQPNYVVIDEGEGQSADRFPDTFLSLLRNNKTRIFFVQGKYNMGSTGVLQFAGTNSFQLIISKRQPDIPSAGSSLPAPTWGFTLVRRIDPTPDQPQTTYVYLAPGDTVPSFEADSLALRPGRYPDPYGEVLEAGTFIKLWNYKIGGLRTVATIDLAYELQEYLQDPALPVRIYERREGYTAHSYETTMAGLSAALYDSPGEIEPGFDTGSPLSVPGVGEVHLRVVVLRERTGERAEKGKWFPSGIFFNVNGQLHGQLGSDFVSRRTNFQYIAKSTIVMVDCTDIPTRVREDVFLASRDRMRLCDERSALEDAIVGYLRDHTGLRELNERRRRERLAASLDEKDTAAIIQQLVKADPTLASLFGHGNKINVPIGTLKPSIPYVGLDFPTYFRLKQGSKGTLVKQCPRNKTCRVEFETDAKNNYFSRTSDPGRLELSGAAEKMSTHLWNGKANLRIAPPAGCAVGDRLNVGVDVSDSSRGEPFNSRFVLEIVADAPPDDGQEGPGGHRNPPAGLTGLPHIVEVKRDEWSLHDFNEYSAISMKSGEDELLDVYINMDNLHLRNEILRRKDLEPALLNYWFKYGILLLSLGMLYRERQKRGANEAEPGVEPETAGPLDLERISEACQGLAVTVIPVISGLGKERSAPVQDLPKGN
jgi:hypothetical protein